jgi:hypothetical protein
MHDFMAILQAAKFLSAAAFEANINARQDWISR